MGAYQGALHASLAEDHPPMVTVGWLDSLLAQIIAARIDAECAVRNAKAAYAELASLERRITAVMIDEAVRTGQAIPNVTRSDGLAGQRRVSNSRAK